MTFTGIDTHQFKKILKRTTVLPLVLAILLSIVFIGLILHLSSTNKMVNHTALVIAKAQESQRINVEGETGLRGFLLIGKESFLAPYSYAQTHFENEIQELKDLTSDNPTQQQRVLKIIENFSRWQTYAEDGIAKKKSGDMSSVLSFIKTEVGKKLLDENRKLFADLLKTEGAILSQQTTKTENTVKVVLLLVLLGGALTGGVLALFSFRQLTHLSNTFGNALDKQAEQNQALQKQAWIRIAQANLSKITRGDKNVSVVCEETLRFLCEYLDAKVATLYVLNQNTLSLESSYALDAQSSKARLKIRLGESLVGQAAKDGKNIVLDPAPKSYLPINSSLGEMESTSILISPATVNEGVKAVFEFGFLRRISPRDLELMETLSEGIGIAITSAEYRVRLEELLTESQRQSEELQAQQEELKVSNEELEEQTKALKESQANLETQQAELEQNNSQLSRQTRMLEEQNDELSTVKQALEHKALDLEKTSQYKSQFLANMSHELRTPLNSTLILSQLLVENKSNHLSADEVDYAKTILTSSNDLLELINDILDLAKVEAGKIDLHSDKIDLPSLMETLQRGFSPVAAQQGIEFVTNVDMKMSPTIETDRVRLEQILKNLVSNAIKFTSKGKVELKVIPKDAKTVSFAVIDTGIGIPQEQQQVIFEAFRQADGSTSRNYGGTGLGLTISRDLAYLLGGEISVESKPGRGSTFTLTIPKVDGIRKPTPFVQAQVSMTPSSAMARPEKPTRPAPIVMDDRSQLKEGTRILMVVEDDVVFAKTLMEVIHDLDYHAIVTHSAEEAIELTQQYLPHAILLDINLPDHSGLFVLDRIKEDPKTRHIPVHIISANDHSAAALQMGAAGYLQKPTDRKKLVQAIEMLDAKVAVEKNVLVVEDNAVQRESIQKLLGDANVKVTTVETGQAALQAMKDGTFDCIVLDHSLPDMNGYELLEKLSKYPKPQPPVVIYTGRSLTREEEAQLQKHAHSIIIKGAKSPERLLSEVSLFLHQVESKMSPQRQKILQELRDREKSFEERTVLLVDDDVRNIFALNSALESKGANILIARNGKEALSQIEKHPEIDLVLMDLMMPEMDGYEAMRIIRKNPEMKNLPIIAVTAKAMADDQDMAIQAGASDYLAKPIDLQKLMSLMRIWLNPAQRN